MPRFSDISKERLETCHPLLIELFNDIILSVDCTILCGHRGKEAQEAAVAGGLSKTHWPDSRHNATPSLAVDAAPWPLEWPNLKAMGPEAYARALGRWYMFIGYVRRAAEERGIALRCGADWNMDWAASDERFHDLPHFELLSTQRA
jgi:hypothetical protein